MTQVLITGLATAYLALAWTEGEIFAPARSWIDDHLLVRGRFLRFIWQWQSCRVCMPFALAQVLHWIQLSTLSGDWQPKPSMFVPAFAAGGLAALWTELVTTLSKGLTNG